MTPSELATMPGDKCILQLRGLPPFFSPKYDLKQHPNYRFTAEADKVKNAFDLDRLIDRRRRPGMNEECEVYEVSVPDEALTDEDEDILNYDDLDDLQCQLRRNPSHSLYLSVYIEFVFSKMQTTPRIGFWLDNSNQTPQQTAENILNARKPV